LLFKDVIAQKEKSAEKVFNPLNRVSALARITSSKAKHSVLNAVAELAHTSAGLSHSSAEAEFLLFGPGGEIETKLEFKDSSAVGDSSYDSMVAPVRGELR